MPLSPGLVVAVALSALLVIAGCTGTTGPADEATGSTPSGAGNTSTSTAGDASVTPGTPAQPPLEITNATEFVLARGPTSARLKGANFTYERVRREYSPENRSWEPEDEGPPWVKNNETGRWLTYDETMWVGRNESIRWITRSGPYVFDSYRPGNGLQYDRAHDTETGETEYLVHNYTDDFFVETLRLGPTASLSPAPYGPPPTEFSYGGVQTFEGERLHVYRGTNSTEEVTVDVTMFVTDDGFIRHAAGRTEIHNEDHKRGYYVAETYRAVNETDVERPDWLDEARNAGR